MTKTSKTLRSQFDPDAAMGTYGMLTILERAGPVV